MSFSLPESYANQAREVNTGYGKYRHACTYYYQNESCFNIALNVSTCICRWGQERQFWAWCACKTQRRNIQCS